MIKELSLQSTESILRGLKHCGFKNSERNVNTDEKKIFRTSCLCAYIMLVFTSRIRGGYL